jgi:hypothetical protein
MARQIITTDKVSNPEQIALYASAVLAADKGIPSTIEIKKGGKIYDVVTDEGKIFRFIQA